MGYYSEVRMCLKKEDYEKLLKEAEKRGYTKEGELFGPNGVDICNIYENEGLAMFGWNSVKWYPSHDDVDFVMDFLYSLRDEEHPYKFVRVGENIGDIEVENYFGEDDEDYSCDRIHVETYIEED